MTDKERLEEIKEKYNYERLEEFIDTKPISPYELKWLIKQAERVEELELEVSDWRAEVQKWQKFYKESEESHLETKELLKNIYELAEYNEYDNTLEQIVQKLKKHWRGVKNDQ